MKIVITGILGLIGNHFGRYLLDKGYEVVGIDDCSGGYIDYLDSRIKFYNRDLSEDWHNPLDTILQIDELNVDYIVHLSAYAAECCSDYIKRYNYKNNVIASVNVINACINNNIKKLVFTSSMAALGEAGVPPFKETDIPNPVDSYGLAKLLIENELKISSHKFGLRFSIVRPHNVVSAKYQNYSDKYRNVLAIWANSIVNKGDINVYSDGSQKRAFSDVRFMLPAMEKLLTGHDGEIFHMGGDNPITILEAAQLMQKIAKELGLNPNIKHLEPRTEVKYAWLNHDKSKEVLGFNDQTNLEEIMRGLLLWVKEQPKREVRHMNYEVTKNLYGYWK